MGIVVLKGVDNSIKEADYQRQIAPFYEYPQSALVGNPGTVVRTSPISFAPKGSHGWRVLYRSQGAHQERTISSGLVFVPDGPAPAGGRPVVAWAHGTVGMGDSCAPSRSLDHLADMDWLDGMLARGWVVTATDYSGFGTKGTLPYLVGNAAAYDVLNSVRAARQVRGLEASDRFAVWGHSQGGQSALFAAALAAKYSPELDLVAAATAAPAAELGPLIDRQYDTAVSWAIGPEIAVAWPRVYKELSLTEILTRSALDNYANFSELFIASSSLLGIARKNLLGQDFFKHNPVKSANWRARLVQNTVPNTPPGIPVIVAQGLSDSVVLPNTTALLDRRYCAAKIALETFWMPGVNHQKSAIVAGPRVTRWLAARFAGKRAPNTCSERPPVKPA